MDISGQKKIVSFHSRRAEKEVYNLLIEHKISNAIFHWYSGSLSLIEKINQAGFYFSINTAMIKSPNGKKIIEKIPKEKILTESDGPFISKNNIPVRPSDVKDVLKYLSELWNLSVVEVDIMINTNFSKLIDMIK